MTEEILCEELSFRLFDSVRITARGWGDADAPMKILCLHGYMDNCATWTPLAKYLVRKHGRAAVRLVAIDFSGHGQSAHLPVHAYNGVWVDEAIKVADALKWEEFVLMGHSMGQAVSFMVAAAIPHRIHKLVLVEGVGVSSIEPDKIGEALTNRLLRKVKSVPRNAKVYPTVESAIDRMQQSNAALSRPAAELLVERGITRVEGGVRFSHDPRLRGSAAFGFLSEDQIMHLIKRITCPVLIVWGTHRWYPVKQEEIEKRTAAFPNCRTVTLEGNHHVHLERANAVGPHISGFLFEADAVPIHSRL